MFGISASSIKRKVFSIALLASLGIAAVPTSAAAVEHIVSRNSILLGANNVDVGGTLYDVQFVDGRYVNVFSNAPVFLNRPDLAQIASQSLIDYVLIDLDIGNFDFPGSTVGCQGTNRPLCNIRTPYGIMQEGTFINLVGFYQASNENPRNFFFGDRVGRSFVSRLEDTSQSDSTVWAVWSVAAVPEPSTYAMLGLGLLGVMGMARRRQNQA